jgi:hypothetical protein
MIKKLYPMWFKRYLSLPIFGSVANKFVIWLHDNGYKEGTMRNKVQTMVHVDRYLKKKGFDV